MDRRICYVHVGTAKTGSSAIQYALTRRHDALLARRYLYPDAAGNFKAVLAGKPTAGNASSINTCLRDGQIERAIQLLRPFCAQPHHLVLSCEGLSNHPGATLQQFGAGLRDLGYEARCLVLFRPQYELVVSSYLQQVKTDKIDRDMSLDAYADKQFKRVGSTSRWNWFARAQSLEQAFGAGNVTVKWYPAIARVGTGAVVRAAFVWLDLLSVYDASDPATDSTVVNPTPGREAFAVLRSVNASGEGGKNFADAFLAKAQQEGLLGSRIRLGRSAMEKIDRATRNDNTALLERYCPELSASMELQLPIVEEPDSPVDENVVAELTKIASALQAERRIPGERKDMLGGLARRPARRSHGTKCIIHIGMHKTGSTSIQKSLQGFADDHFVYANLSQDGNHSLAVFSAFAPNPERHHLHRSGGRTGDSVRAYIDRVLDDLDASISAADGRTLLISGEDIGYLPTSSLRKLNEYLYARVDDVAIMGYVRSPAAYMSSHFQQVTKNASIDTFDPGWLYRSYQKSFEKFDDIFGRENVHLWKFDPEAFPNGCVVQDFCARAGITLPQRAIVRFAESLSRQAASALYTYAKLGEAYGSKALSGKEGVKLGHLIGGKEKFRLSPTVVHPVLEANRADITWMEARLQASLEENLGEHRPGDIRDESDLLRPDPEVVAKLLSLLGNARPAGIAGETPDQVALLIHALRGLPLPNVELLRATSAGQKIAELPTASVPEASITSAVKEISMMRVVEADAQIRLPDIIEHLLRRDPALLEGIPREAAEEFVRKLFQSINEEVTRTEDGHITISELGRFRVTPGQDDGSPRRTRITYRPEGSGRAES
jgi:hypothetical protein